MANMTNMGIPNAGAGILAPKLRYRWQVAFTGLGRLIPSASSRDLSRQCTMVNRPTLEWEEVPIYRYNSTAYVAGKHTWSPLSLTVEDDITGLASAAVTAQLETQQRLIGADLPGQWLNAAATGSDYKFGMTLNMLDGNEGVVETWLIEGAWIRSANFGQLEYSDTGSVATIEMDVRFDHARQLLTGQGYGTSLGGSL